jgi:non-specific protein-tyrosine kinase
LRRQAWLLVLVPVVAAATAAFASSRQTPVYRATMGILASQADTAASSSLTSQAVTQTMTQLVESDRVSDLAVARLGLSESPSTFRKHLHVKNRPDSSILVANYDAHGKGVAVRDLTAVRDALQTVLKERRRVPGSLKLVADVFDDPHYERQVAPTPVKTIGFAFALGLALALIFAFARESIDERVRNAGDAEEWVGAPVIGTLPRGLRGARPPGVPGGAQQAAEAIHLLRTNLEFSRVGRTSASLLVSGLADDGEATVVAANLATALAMSGKDVILVEADLRNSRLEEYFPLDSRDAGLADLMDGQSALGHVQVDHVLQEIPLLRVDSRNGSPNGPGASRESSLGRLRVLPARRSFTLPAALLSRERLQELVSRLTATADTVLFHAPPLLEAGETLNLALSLDGVLMVARQGRTTREQAEAARATLGGMGVANVAVVVTDAGARRRGPRTRSAV